MLEAVGLALGAPRVAQVRAITEHGVRRDAEEVEQAAAGDEVARAHVEAVEHAKDDREVLPARPTSHSPAPPRPAPPLPSSSRPFPPSAAT